MNANLNETIHAEAVARSTRSRHGSIQRGFAYRSALTTIVAVIIFTAAVAYLDPSLVPAQIRPQSKQSSTPATNQAAHEEFTVRLAQLLENCQDVLGIQHNISSASVDVILWLHDVENPGLIDNDEIAILSHERLSRMLTLYSIDDGKPAAASDDKSASRGPLTQAVTRAPRKPMVVVSSQRNRYYGEIISRTTFNDPLFKARWRTQPGVKSQIVAEGLSDLRLERVNDEQQELSHLRLWLRWAADSADGADERSAIIRAPRPTATQE